MELSQEFLIEMAINAGGYVLAGIISILFYAMLQKKKPIVAVNEILENTIPNNQADDTVEDEVERRVEFIAFSNEKNNNNIARQPRELNQNKEQNNGRMNRKDAINLAKKMLLAGATHEKIKKVLPVSESELALLTLNNK